MAFPANSIGTATVIASLPFTTTDNFGGTAFGETWFSYVATADDILVGIHVEGEAGQTPLAVIYTQPGPTQHNPGDPTEGGPIQTPFEEGETYYFYLIGGSDGNANVTLAIQSQPNQTIMTGTILVPDPSNDWYLPPVLLTFAAGAVMRSVTLPNADRIARLPTGEICLAHIKEESGLKVDTINFYQSPPVGPLGTEIAIVANPLPSERACIVAQDYAETFYIARTTFGGGTLTVRRFSKLGVLDSGFTQTLPGSTLNAFAVNVGGTIAYTSDFSSDTPVGAYDLAAGAPLADFAGGVSGYKIVYIAVLSDDSVVVSYKKDADDSIRLIRYNAAGVLQHTWDAPVGQGFVGNVANDLDGVSFVVRTENTGLTTSTFTKLAIADLSELDQFGPIDNFDDGEGRNDTAQFFGPSEAAAIILLVGSSDPVTEEVTMRRQRIWPLWYGENRWGFLRRIEFICQMGVGLSVPPSDNPRIMFRLSRDGGQTWGNTRFLSIGRIGQYTYRAYATALGRGRNFVGEVTFTENVPFAVMQCTAEIDEGTS